MSIVALIDYGSGNLASAAKALARAADGKFDIVTTADSQAVKDAERVVLPGVGAFADCMKGLSAVPGMVEALREKVLKDGAPSFSTFSRSASTMPGTADRPLMQSAKAPTPGSTTRSASSTTCGSAVVTISDFPLAARAKAFAALARLPEP